MNTDVPKVPQESGLRATAQTSEVSENVSIFLALGAGLLGFLVGALRLDEHTPLMEGGHSIGETAALASAGLAGIGFAVVLIRTRRSNLPWYRRLPRLRRMVDVVGLTLMQAALTLFLTAGTFAVLQGSFRQLRLDPWAGSTLVGLACAVAVYLAASSAATLNTESLAKLTAGFLVVGAFASALSAGDEFWWRSHFSALGTAMDISGVTFNFTLIVTGLVIVALSDFLTHDLGVWVRHTGDSRWEVRVVRTALMVMGIMLGMVGVIPVSLSLFWHNFVTYAAIAPFLVLLIGMPLMFPKLPGGFLVVTLGTGAALAGAVVLHRVVGYLNITAFEIVAVTIVLAWLVMFIRTLIAAANDAVRAEQG